MAQNPQHITAKIPAEGSQAELAAAHAHDLASVTATVVAIKRMLAPNATVDLDALTELSTTFDTIGKDTSRRLNKCVSYLSVNNLASAVELSEAAPALLDVLRQVASVDAKAWNALLAKHKRVPPPPLNSRQMKQLEDAYAQPEALALLRKACDAPQQAKASTLERIASARRMRLLDRGNPDWITRLSALEVRRQNEILAIVSAKTAPTHSLQDAGELVAELAQPQWLVLPPQKLIEAAKQFQNQIRQQELEEMLDGVLDKILEAREQHDYVGMENILRDVKSLSDDAGIPPGQLEAIQEARDWLATQNEKFHQQINELELLLDDLAPSRQVRYVLREIEETGRALPPIMFQRTTSYLAQHDIGERRRSRQLRVVLILVALAAAAAAVWYVINKA